MFFCKDRSGCVFGAVLLVSSLAACVTETVERDSPDATTVVQEPVHIQLAPMPGAGGPVDDYYRSIVAQMRDAAAQRDLPRLRSLLDVHNRSAAPAWAKSQMARFDDLAMGMVFEMGAPAASSISLAGDAAPIGAPIEFVYRLKGPLGEAVRLEGEDGETATSFLVSFAIEDLNVFGGRTKRSFSSIVNLPRSIDLDQKQMELPFSIALAPVDAVIRAIAVKVELLPGRIMVDGQSVPHRRVQLIEHEEISYPKGVELVKERPLDHLRTVVKLKDPKFFAHQLLAIHFMPEASKVEAMELLMQQVRLGNPEQVRVAMACLSVLVDSKLSIKDRNGWLRWWRAREK
ncbi:MAG: hypothetical protein QF412_11890 [Planctomycetota bacterium]|nr:hypothetical protein [Planctomycetota bacterium]